MEAQRIKPSGWFYVLGLAVFLFGCLAATVAFSVGMVGMVDSAIDVDRMINEFDRVVVPGTAQLELDEAGSYTIFYEYRGTLDGVPFSSTRSRPRLNCQLRERESGDQVPLYDAWLQKSNYELPDRSGTMLMRFDVDRADTYVLTCEYAGGGDAPEAVLAIGTGFVRNVLDLVARVFVGLLLPIPLIFSATMAAGLIVVIVAVLRHRSSRQIAGEAS